MFGVFAQEYTIDSEESIVTSYTVYKEEADWEIIMVDTTTGLCWVEFRGSFHGTLSFLGALVLFKSMVLFIYLLLFVLSNNS